MRQRRPAPSLRPSAGTRAAICAIAAMLAACAAPERLPSPVISSPAPSMQDQGVAETTPGTVPVPVMRPRDPATTVRHWIAQQDRLYRVGAPILLNNTPLCPEHTRNLLGFTAKTKYSYSDEFIDEAQTYLGLDDRLRITEVLPGSGASLAGIREGDILLAVEIEPIPEGENAEEAASSLIASELQGRSSLNLTVLRGEERIGIEVPLTSACAMKIDVGHTDEVNAYGDGRRVMITRGMLNFVASDDELGYVIAREVARNVLFPRVDHEKAQSIDRLGTPDSGAAGGTNASASSAIGFDPAVERLALYMTVRGGYDISRTGDFWRRLFSLSYGSENASTDAERLGQQSRIVELVKEISARQEQGMPLIPEP